MNVEHLELGETLSKVSGEYKQYLRYNGGRLSLRTNPMHLESLTVIERQDSKSVCIPIDSWMNEQLTTVQNFMEKNVTIPADVEGRAGVAAFKPLIILSSLFIMVSKFCQYLFYDEALKTFNVFSPAQYALGKGLYVFTIDLPYVYLGKQVWSLRLIINDDHPSRVHTGGAPTAVNQFEPLCDYAPDYAYDDEYDRGERADKTACA